MPNYYSDIYNALIDNAGELHRYLSGNYMDSYENRLLDCGDSRIEIGPMQFIRILQYRRTQDAHNDLRTIHAAMSAALGCCARREAAFGYFIVSREGKFSIYLAVEDSFAASIVSQMTGAIPEIAFKSGFIPPAEARRLSAYGGVINGDLHCMELTTDALLQAFGGNDGILYVLAVPMEQTELSAYLDAINAMQQRTGALLNNESVASSQPRRANQRSYRFLPALDTQLKSMSEYYRESDEDFWKTCIWFSGENRRTASAFGNAAAGILNAANDGADKARVFLTTDNPVRQGRFFLPSSLFGVPPLRHEDALAKPSLLSYVSTSHLASVMQLPSASVNGFDVIELIKTDRSLRLFDMDHQSQQNAIQLGNISGSSASYAAALEDITEHVLITGATGTGKTNTVFKLVEGVHACGVPILIIEPSKKDYWKLAGDLRDMQIYSFGRDAKLLRINPLIPEEGVIIGNHIDSLLYAFAGAFEMEEPTRLALDGLLKYTYERFDWKSGDIAFHSGRAFPEIKDLLELLPAYCSERLPYGDEVRNNIYGSLVNRLSSLNSGIIGDAVNASRSITGKELCSGTVLVELDDLSLETKPFMAMLLMIKADQYLRQRDAAGSLKNVIVLEEAHNIFPSVASGNTGSPGKRASRYFSNMLSQIREYGVGIMIADQGASQINDMAISNTKIKIIHGIVNRDDIEKVAFSLQLSDIQKTAFPALRTGEAIASVRGERKVVCAKIDRVLPEAIRNTGCIFCDRRKHCRDFNQESLPAIPRKALYAQRIMEKRFHPVDLNQELHGIAVHLGIPQDQELCLLGQLLSDTGLNCGEREKRRIIMRYLQTQEVSHGDMA